MVVARIIGRLLIGAVMVEYCCIAFESAEVGVWLRTMMIWVVADGEEADAILARAGSTYGAACAGRML